MSSNIPTAVVLFNIRLTNPLFAQFSSSALPFLANEAHGEKFATEEIVLLKGTIGSKFYMILRGGCESYLSNEKEGEEIMITKLVPSSFLARSN